jgi:hypothetical protein
MLTIFHFMQLLGAGVGLVMGLDIGHQEFGVTGTIVSGFAGVVCGYLLGALPYAVAGIWIRQDLKHCDTTELKARLDRQYAISHLIIAQLVRRGEPVEQFRGYVDSLRHSGSADRRRFGDLNHRIWFPEIKT